MTNQEHLNRVNNLKELFAKQLEKLYNNHFPNQTEFSFSGSEDFKFNDGCLFYCQTTISNEHFTTVFVQVFNGDLPTVSFFWT